MGLDGFSMSNLGLPERLTSAQMADRAEQLATQGTEYKIKDSTQLATQNGVQRKESDSGGFTPGYSGNFRKKKGEESENDENKNQEILNQVNFEEKDSKDFSVKVNPETETIELYSLKNQKIVETISADDLRDLILKLDDASGVFVNKKI